MENTYLLSKDTKKKYSKDNIEGILSKLMIFLLFFKTILNSLKKSL